jgi:SAM-dependent methyltransferase
MVDRIFAEPSLATLYDLLAPWGEPDDRFYLPLVMAARSVLDIGCGTGQLLHAAREAGHTGRLTGLDPANAMLDVARTRDDIDWILGDPSTVSFDREFDLIVMTGHAFQVFLTDEQLRTSLAAIRAALTDEGRFAFETRNPLARAWEDWTTDKAVEIVAPNGDVVSFSRHVDEVTSDTVGFTSTFASSTWDKPQLSQSTLRFLDAAALTTFLSDASLTIEEQYGDWNRQPLTDASPEIIVIARRGSTSAVVNR